MKNESIISLFESILNRKPTEVELEFLKIRDYNEEKLRKLLLRYKIRGILNSLI